MELGGNAPAIVFDDADLETAVSGVIAAKYRNTGESCIGATASMFRPGSTTSFAEKFTERTVAAGRGRWLR